MSDKELQADEANAPIVTDGPLPLSVTTLAYIPKDKRQQYVRTMEGSFRLDWIHSTDTESLTAYQAQLGKGRLRVFDEGETPATHAAKQRAGEEMAAKALQMADELAAKQKAERDRANKARYDAENAALRAKYGLSGR